MRNSTGAPRNKYIFFNYRIRITGSNRPEHVTSIWTRDLVKAWAAMQMMKQISYGYSYPHVCRYSFSEYVNATQIMMHFLPCSWTCWDFVFVTSRRNMPSGGSECSAMLWYICTKLSVPEHLSPSPVYPALQVQLKDPKMFLQFAFSWQSFPPSSHSLISRK